MNVVEQMEIDDIAGTSLAEPANYQAYREMIVPSAPSWVEEHVRRLSAAGIQSAFQFYNINSYETVERLIRRGVYKGPLVMQLGGDRRRHGPADDLQPGRTSCAPSPTARC